MTNLIENLLSLVRADGGAEAMTLVPIEVRTPFQNVDQTWKTSMQLQLALIDFRVEMQGDNLVLLGDSSGISRLLSILLENARKYTPPGGSVVLNAKVSGDCVAISVRDTGIGISAEDIPRIFDRFYRAEQAGDPTARGSGLG